MGSSLLFVRPYLEIFIELFGKEPQPATSNGTTVFVKHPVYTRTNPQRQVRIQLKDHIDRTKKRGEKGEVHIFIAARETKDQVSWALDVFGGPGFQIACIVPYCADLPQRSQPVGITRGRLLKWNLS